MRLVDICWINIFMPRKIVMYDKVQSLVEPTTLSVDLVKLRDAVDEISKKIPYDPANCLNFESKQSSINFTHPANIPESIIAQHGEFKSKFVGGLSGGETVLKEKYNMSTADFTEMDALVSESYIKVVFDQIQNYHNSKFGVGSIRWVHGATLGPGAGFNMHVDKHCLARYHVVLYTNDYSYTMVEQNNEIKIVHMPADGQVWFLNTNVLHNATNLIPSRSKDNLRTHLIFSVYI